MYFFILRCPDGKIRRLEDFPVCGNYEILLSVANFLYISKRYLLMRIWEKTLSLLHTFTTHLYIRMKIVFIFSFQNILHAVICLTIHLPTLLVAVFAVFVVLCLFVVVLIEAIKFLYQHGHLVSRETLCFAGLFC